LVAVESASFFEILIFPDVVEPVKSFDTARRERERESDDDDALKSTVDVESIRFPPVVKEFEYFPCVARWLTTQISLSLSLSLCPGDPPHSRKVA
jgi:hypothetical protein